MKKLKTIIPYEHNHKFAKGYNKYHFNVNLIQDACTLVLNTSDFASEDECIEKCIASIRLAKMQSKLDVLELNIKEL